MMRLDPSKSRLQDLSNEYSWVSNNLRSYDLCPSQSGTSCRSKRVVRKAGPSWMLSDLPPGLNLLLTLSHLAGSSPMLLNINKLSSWWEHIRCKPISPWKLWKLQSGSSDQHPRGMWDWVILQSGPALGLDNHTFANPSSHLPAPLPLDVDLMAQIEVFIVCTERLVCT